MKLHLDLDCYFVSAERTRCKYLKNKPVVVCKSGDKAIFSTDTHSAVVTPPAGAFNSIFQLSREYKGFDRNAWKREFIDERGHIHGIVIAKSYEAKKYGIKTGTPIAEAILMCKELIILPSDHLFYQTLSHRLREYLELKLPLVEQYSIDEFFADVSGWVKDSDVADFIKELQEDILRQFDLPITIAASRSKWISKLATDKNKPFGTKVIYDNEIADYIRDVPVEEFAGVGRQTLKKLHSRGIKTIGEIYLVKALFDSWGKSGRELYERMLGVDNDPVVPHHDRKSIGISRNFPPVMSRIEIYRRATILSRHLAFTINRLCLNPITFFFKIRYEDYSKSKLSLSIDRIFNEREFIDLSLSTIKRLDIYPHLKIRYLTISASNFVNRQIYFKPKGQNEIRSTLVNPKPYSLFTIEKGQKLKALDNSLCKIRDRWDVDLVRYGCELG